MGKYKTFVLSQSTPYFVTLNLQLYVAFFRFTTITASCMVPCITSMIYQVKNVMNPILLRDYDCPMCITSRAATGQVSHLLFFKQANFW